MGRGQRTNNRWRLVFLVLCLLLRGKETACAPSSTAYPPLIAPGEGRRERWPVSLGAMVNSSPALGDLDGDGRLETVVGDRDGWVHVLQADGQPAANWPQKTGGEVFGAPTLGDVDGDGREEIVVASRDGRVYVWLREGTLLPNWPQKAEGAIIAAPTLADVTGDGRPEILVGTTAGRFYVWQADAQPLPGWPQEVGASVQTSAAVGDVTGDGRPEITVTSADHRWHLWSADGTPLPAWPRQLGQAFFPSLSSPVLADLDGDGRLDLVVGTNAGQVLAVRADGTLLPGWPAAVEGEVDATPAVGDLDGDGRPEVVLGTLGPAVYAWHADGTPVAGFPAKVGQWVRSSAALVDVDRDGRLEILVGADDGRVYGWRSNGTPLAGLNWQTEGRLTASPAVGDVDGDGRLDVVIADSKGSLYRWPAPGETYSLAALVWPTFQGNPARTGVFIPPQLTAATYPFPAGLHFLSLPLEPGRKPPGEILGAPEKLRWARWSPGEEGYRLYDPAAPDPFLNLQAGTGYWWRTSEPREVQVLGRSEGNTALLPLEPGWNALGVPFFATVEWDWEELQVVAEGATFALREAAERGLIEPYAWGWNAGQEEYFLVCDPQVVPSVVGHLEPWQGYWVKAHRRIALRLRRPIKGRVTPPCRPSPGRPEPPQWVLEPWVLTLEAGGSGWRERVQLGLVKGQTGLQAEIPPPSPTAPSRHLVLWVNGRREPLACDLRPLSAPPWRWQVEVRTEEAVSLRWPRLGRELPGRLQAQITDLNTGKGYLLPPISHLSLPPGQHRLEVEIAPRRDPPLQLTRVQVKSLRGREVMINYLLSGEAEVKGRICTLGGRSLRRERIPGRAGVNIWLWDGRDGQGRPLPAGVYLVEVEAIGLKGGRVRVERTFHLP
ncbi:MAG TPA: hypothetical protein EYP85_02485 [Armatimonadetes bacterium]|nr:hypothetical protein [Armatimonadota bacterium]